MAVGEATQSCLLVLEVTDPNWVSRAGILPEAGGESRCLPFSSFQGLPTCYARLVASQHSNLLCPGNPAQWLIHVQGTALSWPSGGGHSTFLTTGLRTAIRILLQG